MRAIESRLSQRLSPAPEPGSSSNDILLLGIGNFLMGDEGIGVPCTHRLEKQVQQLIHQIARGDEA